jgi:hypothetical protein
MQEVVMPAMLVMASAFSQIRVAARASWKKEKVASYHSLTAIKVECAQYLHIKTRLFWYYFILC